MPLHDRLRTTLWCRSPSTLRLSPLDDEDAAVVGALLTRHAEETGSPGAKELLQSPDWRSRFTRVLPEEYARMTRAMAQAQADGLDPAAPGVWDHILEVSRG